MAEAVVFSLASKVLSTIASPAFNVLYKEGLSIYEAKDELSKLQATIKTIQEVLLDAEQKQHGSDDVRDCIKRLKGVFYDADDLFDNVATQDLLKQQNKKEHHNLISNMVRVSCFKLNPIITRYSIAKEVKALRKRLVEIKGDMDSFRFMICQNEIGTRTVQDRGCFVDAELVVGREGDKEVIREMLFDESNSVVRAPLVIAIVGIGGLGKTTLSQLIYNDAKVKEKFSYLWFACISDISDEREVVGIIFQSINEENHSSLSVSQLQTKIRDSVKGKRFLLVLDDVWEDNRARWQDRISLFRSCAEGSKLIVTTRLRSVVDAVSASRCHNLEGLSEENAWCLFKSFAFSPDYENDPIRISLGKEILKRCRGVPLAIRTVGSLLFERNTISEWQAIEKEGLQKIGGHLDETMRVIKLSYDHLPSNLKHCFAYCSLFPKDYKFLKRELIHLWGAQGYVEPNNEETDFMHLLRRGFFQESEKDSNGEVISCKMHDIMHDLALYVAGEESIATSATTPKNTSSSTRHISVEGRESEVALLKVERVRSFLLMRGNSIWNQTALDKLFQNFKMLRALSLKGLGENLKLPSSIGELILMRYLDLSSNHFEVLPNSITNLVNLFALNLEGCSKLTALPEPFEKLINLRYLNNKGCFRLIEMPLKIGELTRLQYLGEFVVRNRSGVDALAGLHQQLRGELFIRFLGDIGDIDECNWKLPVCVQTLRTECYEGARIPDWGTINGIERTNNHLTVLELIWCEKVKRLPPLHLLPNLRSLDLRVFYELEFVEWEEEDECSSSSSPFFPRLEKLTLIRFPLLKRWRKTASTPLAFPLLSILSIEHCPLLELASFPQCPRLRQIGLREVDNGDVMPHELPSTLFCPSVSPPPLEGVYINECKWLSSIQVEATTSLQYLRIFECSGLKSLQLASPRLQHVVIQDCEEFVSLEAATPSLVELKIIRCKEFMNLITTAAPMNLIETIRIYDCAKYPTFPSESSNASPLKADTEN